MLVLHTSDWHAGRTTYNRSRGPDHDTVYSEIIAVARETRPDLILHSGDLLDHSRIAHTEMDRAVAALVELSAIAPTVVVAGNHDSATLFGLFGRLRGDGRLRFVTRPLGANGTYLRVGGSDGVGLRLGLLPFVNSQQGVDVFDDPGRWAGDYRRRVGAMQADIAAGLLHDLDRRREVTMFSAHLHVSGAGLAGTERARHVNDEYATDPPDVPGVDYAAFGHIHQSQELPGAVTGRYAGSPLALDFGERGQTKSVALVRLEPGKAPVVELADLSGGRRLHRFDGTIAELRRDVDRIGDALCLVTVRTDTTDPSLSQQVHDLLARATVLDVTQVAADRMLPASVAVEPRSADTPAGYLDMFADYLTTRGTLLAPAVRVHADMAELLAALGEEREPVFVEEALLTTHTCAEEHR